ncbi:hypothetical protein FK545_11225 [Planococcus glaciei]|nr:hypothetical protein [Planococcus glaciei]QDY45786.1 hypothetical protein FK545_11225 [Planococcus glaciei]
MIKYMLERIKERVEQEKKTEASANENLLRIKLNLENLNLDIEKNNEEVTEKIVKRKQQIENDIQLLEIRKLSWNTIFSTVRNYLDLSLFNVQEEEPEWTHLFVSHPVYRSIFEVYEQITSLSPSLTSQERDFEKAMVSSPHLYEVWILFQLIRQLQKVQFNSKDIVNSMIEHFKVAGTLSGWRKIFKSSNGLAGIYYEKEFQLENGRNAKPDYTLIFKKK